MGIRNKLHYYFGDMPKGFLYPKAIFIQIFRSIEPSFQKYAKIYQFFPKKNAIELENLL